MRKTFPGLTGFLWENLGFRVGMGGFFVWGLSRGGCDLCGTCVGLPACLGQRSNFNAYELELLFVSLRRTCLSLR